MTGVLYVILCNALLAFRPELTAIDVGWNGGRGLTFHSGLGLVWTSAAAARARCVCTMRRCSPAASSAGKESMARMRAMFPILTSRALWNPRFCARICALPDLSGVFPIVFSAVPPACWASGVLSWRRACIPAARVEAARLCSGYSIDVNRICLRMFATHHEQTLIVIIVREGVIGVEIAWVSEG